MLNLERPEAADLAGAGVTTSADERERVLAARERQAERLHGTRRRATRTWTRRCSANAPMPRRRRSARCSTPTAAGTLSARGRDRALRVARTIADLDGVARIARAHVVAALGYRHDQDLADGEAA